MAMAMPPISPTPVPRSAIVPAVPPGWSGVHRKACASPPLELEPTIWPLLLMSCAVLVLQPGRAPRSNIAPFCQRNACWVLLLPFSMVLEPTTCPLSLIPWAWLLVPPRVPRSMAAVELVTVTVAVLLRPSLMAVMTASPALTPVTTPFGSTVATPGASLAQLTVLPVSSVPCRSSTVAVKLRGRANIDGGSGRRDRHRAHDPLRDPEIDVQRAPGGPADLLGGRRVRLLFLGGGGRQDLHVREAQLALEPGRPGLDVNPIRGERQELRGLPGHEIHRRCSRPALLDRGGTTRG